MLDVIIIIRFSRSDGDDCSDGGDSMLITGVCRKYCSTNAHISDISW